MATNHQTLPILSFQQAIECVWQLGLSQLNSGATAIQLPDNITNLIGPDGLSAIVYRFRYEFNQKNCAIITHSFSALIKNRAVFLHDPVTQTINVVHFQHPLIQDTQGASSTKPIDAMSDVLESTSISLSPNSESSTNSKTSRKSKAPVPRPPNAFILYRQYHHPSVKAMRPDLHNNQICKYG